jgi:hypothetical protein
MAPNFDHIFGTETPGLLAGEEEQLLYIELPLHCTCITDLPSSRLRAGMIQAALLLRRPAHPFLN